MQWKRWMGGLLMAAVMDRAAGAQFQLLTSIGGFTDVNGNGTLDCSEPVKIFVFLGNPDPILSPAQAFSGTLSFPTAAHVGLIFIPGSVTVENDLSAGCGGFVTAGNSPEDLSGAVDFTCNGGGPGVKPAITVSYQALYYNSSSATYSATAHAHVVTAAGTLELEAPPSGNNPPPSGTCVGSPNQVNVVKTESGTAAPGATIVYTVSATDTTGLGDGGVQLTDVVPDHTTFSAAGSDPGWVCPSSAAGSLCRLPIGNIVPNGTVTRFFAVTVDRPLAADVSSLTNTACARGGPVTVLGCGSTTTPTAGAATAKLAKSLKSGSGAPGTTLVYQLTVSDVGNQDLGATTLAETVPVNTSFDAAASAPGWSCSGTAAGSTCSLAVAPIAAGASQSALFAVDVAATLPTGTNAINNTACVQSTGGAALDCSTLRTPTTGTPSLSLHKSVAGSAIPGATLTYTIAVQNTGNEGASIVSVTDQVPANTSFVASSSSAGWSCSPSAAAGSLCTLTIPTLPALAVTTLTFAVQVASPLPANATAIVNTACATLFPNEAKQGAVPQSCDSVTTPTQGSPRLGLAKTYSGGPVLPGAILSFQLQVSNTGNQDAGAVTLAETVPAHGTFASAASSAGWSCSPGPAAGASCSLTLPGLAAGASQGVVFAVKADPVLPPAATILNAACATSSSGGNTLSACSSTSTPPELSTDTSLAVALELDADHSGGASPGDTLRYTLVIPNATASTLTALVARLNLDPNETLVAGSVATDHGTVTTGNAPGDATVAVAVGDLPVGQTATVRFDTTINPVLPAGTTQVTAQAETSGPTIPTDPSGDPATPSIDDNPTSIAVTVAGPHIATVPTLNTLGLGLLAALLVAVGLASLRRRPAGA